ncbi:hypothetical protein M6D81_15315 [Paenibacillus sp. J5C_2022]|uniref:hypothetical protein n=1 Tax=Paenibacillus sp. J5C2022 TaxID=2977129 RepID=UPI0021CECF4D|nr:hypothetical protein [Paenibacillus sp. J5C2022]MCU6710065.1 hypothetical protein [Paenibacillus sp. J5C2022]
METPLIQIGDILRGHGYGGDVIVRCHAIIPYGHRIHYRLEWRVRGEDRWATAFQVAGNDSLREFLHRQGNGRNAN